MKKNILKYSNILKVHKHYFNLLLTRNESKLKGGFYSKPYVLRLSNELVTFRFYAHPNKPENKTVVFESQRRTSGALKPLQQLIIKENYIRFFDKKLKVFLDIKKDVIFKSIEEYKKIEKNKSTYFLIDHSLSDTEKELLLTGKDITVSVTVKDSSSHKSLGTITKNITADLSYFLSELNPLLKEKRERKNQSLNLFFNKK